MTVEIKVVYNYLSGRLTCMNLLPTVRDENKRPGEKGKKMRDGSVGKPATQYT